MSGQERVLGGNFTRPLPRPNRVFRVGRVCAWEGCETRLSIYSGWRYCWLHEPAHAFVSRAPKRPKEAA